MVLLRRHGRNGYTERDQILGEDRVDPTTGNVLQKGIRQSTSAADYRFTFLQDEVDSSGWDLSRAWVFDDLDLEISGGQDMTRRRAAIRRRNSGSAPRRVRRRRFS